VGPRAKLDVVIKKNPCPYLESNTGRPARTSLASNMFIFDINQGYE